MTADDSSEWIAEAAKTLAAALEQQHNKIDVCPLYQNYRGTQPFA